MGEIIRTHWDGNTVKSDSLCECKTDNGQYPHISALELEFG